MKLSDAYPSKYLAAEDLDSDVIVTILDTNLEEIGQGAQKGNKLILTLKGYKKKLVLNKTNAKAIADVLGDDDTDSWEGKKITIGPRDVEYQGEMVSSIRVVKRKAAPAKPAPVEEQEQDADEDSPF